MESLESFNSLAQPESVTRVSEAEMTVKPRQSLMDEKINISVTGLSPRQPITIAAKLTGDSQEKFESYGHFIADDEGRVHLAERGCHAGTYTGVDAMGLLWSMRLAPGQRKGQRLSKKDPTKPYHIHLQLFDGHVEDFRNAELQPMTSVKFEKWYMAPGVRRIPVREGRLRGTLFIPHGKGPFPGKFS